MDFNKYRMRLHKVANSENGSYQRYSLTYSLHGEKPEFAAFNIISALAADNDVVMEFDADLFPERKVKGMSCSEKLLSDMRSLGLIHSYKKVPSDRRTVYFGLIVSRKKVELADKIAAYVPSGVWKSESFKDVVPACGARFYVVKESMDADAAVNGIWDMSEDEKASAFLLNAFSVFEFGQMGIVSETLGGNEIRSLLGIE